MKKLYEFRNITNPTLLSELLRSYGVPFGMPCGGKGTCGKCKVRVFGETSEITEFERMTLTKREIADNMRLACMTYALNDVTVSITGDKYSVPSFEKEEKKRIPSDNIGVAVDIGTTTITVAVYDLDKKEIICSDTELNTQSVFGADVISRLQKSLEGKSAELQAAVCSCITGILRKLNPEFKPLKNTVLTGNTAMLYLLTNRNPLSITRAPFKADCLFGSEINSESLPGFSPFCDKVYLPVCISAFVGADITCAALDCSLRFDFSGSDGKARILADIGTNGELMLSYGDKLLCCSTAAGPAFEAATLYSGTVAKEGAINSLSFRDEKINYTKIGDAKETGICGSGVVDAVAVMLKAGILDETGLILKQSHSFPDCIVEVNGANAFRIPGTNILITQEDIRNIQLAKSAIHAGLVTLIDKAGFKNENIDELIIAGGFGGCINTESAAEIGLIPRFLKNKTRIAGNSALKGAALLLYDPRAVELIEKITTTAETIDLTTSVKFFDEYISGMGFTTP
ncbi:MAG: ASKHA domain-containing protein [Acutalibacteraceae bacterium]